MKDESKPSFSSFILHPSSFSSAALLADYLTQLPADYREVIVFRNLEGLAFEEVARRMGRTPGAVRVLWVRALDRLRQLLPNEELP